ncbi:MAG TPA: hypothetical protein VEV65_09670 [Kineosporiaceae bacterium]|nr:hypothetical protein [Kineosporiaceae bacterium]
MVLKSILVAGGSCALVAGVAVAGSAAGAPSSAPSVPAVAPAGDTALASAVIAADGDSATPADTAAAQTLGRRRDLLCARVPRAITRTENLEKRLAAGASTQGSIAYLEGRIATAQTAHQDQLVTVLQNRLTYRKQLASFLPQRLELLQTARRTVCAPAPAPSSSSSPSS